MAAKNNEKSNGTSDGELYMSKTQLSEAHGAPLPLPIPTFRQLLAESAQKYSRNIALVSMYQPSDLISIEFPQEHQADNRSGYLRWTHWQLQYTAEVLAAGFRAQGVCRGQPIVTLLYNCAEWAILLRTAAILRCPFVPLNPRSLANVKEMEHMLTISKAQVLVAADVQMANKLEENLPQLLQNMKLRTILEKDAGAIPRAWCSFYDLFRNVPKQQNGIESDSQSPEEGGAVALIVFTSGTTSLPKGGIHTNTSMSSSLISQAIALKHNESNRTCCHMPTYHVGGINVAMGQMIAGGSAVFPSKSFDPASSLYAVSREKCTNMPCVPAMVQALANHADLKYTDTTSLRNVDMGATTILPEHLKQVHTALKCPSASNVYGATEAIPITVGFFDSSAAETVNAGSVCPGARIRICAPDSRIPTKRGQPGELHLGGWMTIKCYLENASSESFYGDEYGQWFISGDQGIMADDGTITISGRYKDLITRGGENIAPAAIEAVLDTKLGVTTQVVGVRSKEAGEVPIAVTQSKDYSGIPTTEIRQAIVGELGAAFIPEKFYNLEELGLKDYPRTSSGKVRKMELKALVQKHEDMLEERDDFNDVASGSCTLEDKLTSLWHKTIGVDVKTLNPDTSITEFADSLTIMRFRNRIKRDLGLEITTEQLLGAGTIKKQAAILSSKSNSPTATWSLGIQREGPPGSDDVAIALGNPDIAAEIRKRVTETIASYGFTWEDDVEDVLPSWDLGYEVFGSIVGTAKVNHRMSLSTKKASVKELHAAMCKAVKHHAMQRSFELRGLNGEPTMRVIMRGNEKWLRYSVEEIPEVDHPDDLERLIYDGVHFAEVVHPYPSFLVRIAHIKSTNTAGIIWALQHSAFDGLSLNYFLEDLDSLLVSPSTPLRPHVPYKLWADMYYLHRSSLSATRSVTRQIRRLRPLLSYASSLFPPPPTTPTPTKLAEATQRKTFVAPMLFAPLPHLSSLRTTHDIPPFILIKAALALFLARKTNTGTALFSQNENGRSWPFVEEWTQALLPNCMDLAGPTLERTVQIVPIPASISVLSFMRSLKATHDAEAPDVHAPWNLVRAGLGNDSDRGIFDAAAMSTCLNYLPVRTRDGKVVFEGLTYHEMRANCETAWLFNCGVEGEGESTRMWTQILADEEVVSREEAVQWAEEVIEIVTWMGRGENWDRELREKWN